MAANFTHTLRIKNSPPDISGHSSLLLGVGLLLGRRRLVIIALVLEDVLVGVGIILVEPDRSLIENVFVAVNVVCVEISQVVVLVVVDVVCVVVTVLAKNAAPLQLPWLLPLLSAAIV